MDAQELRTELAGAAPKLWQAIAKIAEPSSKSVLEHLAGKRSKDHFPKTINDPIWGSIELYPWEVAILDSPLLQRLRGVSQLGLAYYVYPGASHSRLEHILGVVEAADRMIRALERNADNHRNFGKDKDPEVPRVEPLDRHSVRLGALLHDIGHGPFSHVTEGLLETCLPEDFKAAEGVLRRRFEGVTKIATSEVVAALLVLSDGLRCVFEHPHFEAVTESSRLSLAIAARILGSRSYLGAGYLSGIISGPIDADKIDYMARDSCHSGFPIGLDLDRLISKLEVIIIKPDNTRDEQLRQRAMNTPGQRAYEMGISLSGLGAYEQMVIGRVLLYDRLYYHHKVRAAEAMLRKVVEVAADEQSGGLSLADFFTLFSEGEYLALWSGALTSATVVFRNVESAQAIAGALLSRHIYHRAFAFAPRFIVGLEGLPEDEGLATRQLLYDNVLTALQTEEGRSKFASHIVGIAKSLGECVPELAQAAAFITAESVLIDFPPNKTVVSRGNDILTRTEGGEVVPPNLFFDPEKWSQAYANQKHVGHVFAPAEHVALVCLASKIAFYDRFGIIMGRDAENASKTRGLVRNEWIATARDHQVCSPECAEALVEERPRLLRINEKNLLLPEAWKTDDPGLVRRLADGFDEALPEGLPATAHKRVLDTINDLAIFVDRIEKSGKFVGMDKLPEKKVLQQELKEHLLSRGVPVKEGLEVGGGETDLVLYDATVVENKVEGVTSDPFGSGAGYQYQSRRYSIALLQRVTFVVVAYHPKDENHILPLSHRIRVSKMEGTPEDHAQVRFVVPYGTGVPSAAKPPKSTR